MSMMNKLQTVEVTPRAALLSLTVLALAAAGAVTAVIKLSSGAPAPPVRPPAPRPAVQAAQPAPSPHAGMPDGQVDYTVITKRNLFRSLTPVIPDAVPAPLPLPLPLPIMPYKPPAQHARGTATATAPFALSSGPYEASSAVNRPPLAFTGLVELAGDKYALLEHLTEHAVQYTRVGGTAYGCQLKAVDAQSATVEYSGETFTLTIGENKPDTEPKQAPAKNGDADGEKNENATSGDGTGAGNGRAGGDGPRSSSGGQRPSRRRSAPEGGG